MESLINRFREYAETHSLQETDRVFNMIMRTTTILSDMPKHILGAEFTSEEIIMFDTEYYAKKALSPLRDSIITIWEDKMFIEDKKQSEK